MSSKHDLLHNIKPTKPCPIKWDDMNGGDVMRTCGKCGALVLNEQEADPGNSTK